MTQYFQDLAHQFSHPVTAIAQVMGFIPMLLGFFVFYFNDRKKTLAIKAYCDTLFVIHFFMLGQLTGGMVCAVNILRSILFSQRGKRKYLSMWWVPTLICLLTVGGSLLSWAGPMSLLPMFGSAIAAIGYWCNDTRHLRKFNFVGVSLWLVYSVLAMSVSSIISNCISLSSIIRTEIALYLHKRKADKA